MPYQVFTDRSTFESTFADTLVDTGSAFAPEPLPGTFSVVTRTGTGPGSGYAYDTYLVDFSLTPTGEITPGSTGGDIGVIRTLRVEDPVTQDGATIVPATWGFDESSGGSTTRNALLFDFVNTPGGARIGHFGVDLLDVETSAAYTLAEVRLYRAGSLVYSQDLDFFGNDGNGVVNFLGLAAIPTAGGAQFDQVMLVVGDNGEGGGLTNHLAAHGVSFGQDVAIPEPHSLALLGIGLVLLGISSRRRGTFA